MRRYVYGIIGAAGPVDFYHRACGAVPITLNGGKLTSLCRHVPTK